MENLSIDEFKIALNDVRKAHRLIYEYQSRMLDLITLIYNKLGFQYIDGRKYFSKPISFKKNNNDLKVFRGMWGWDFIYSYCFNYYFGQIATKEKQYVSLSINQYSDTGFYDIEESDKEETNTFLETENSISKLLFILECRSTEAKECMINLDEITEDKKYASKNFEKETIKSIKGVTQIIYSFPLERFINEKSTMEALKEFNNYCKEHINIDFKI